MRASSIKRSDVVRCPIRSLRVEHYEDDGSCGCLADNNLRDAFRLLLRKKRER